MNEYIQLLFIFGGAAFITWWFLLGILNPFIEAAVSIVMTGIITTLEFFIHPFKLIWRIVKRFFNWFLAPVWMKIFFYTILGCGVFILDHYYNTKIFAEDETTFYKVVLSSQTYWITDYAAWIGGFFIGLAVLYQLDQILTLLNWLLDRPFTITIVFQK